MLYKFHLIARGKTFASNLEILIDNAVKTVKPFYDFFSVAVAVGKNIFSDARWVRRILDEKMGTRGYAGNHVTGQFFDASGPQGHFFRKIRKTSFT